MQQSTPDKPAQEFSLRIDRYLFLQKNLDLVEVLLQ